MRAKQLVVTFTGENASLTVCFSRKASYKKVFLVFADWYSVYVLHIKLCEDKGCLTMFDLFVERCPFKTFPSCSR